MKILSLPFALVLFLSPAFGQAQVNIHIDLGLPPTPRLVIVQPGIQVVEGIDEEVFFNSGWYWCRRPNGWYRSRSPRSQFYWVEGRRVPQGLVRMPEGHYRNWHHEGGSEARREMREERKQEQREIKEDRKQEQRERKEDRKQDKRDRKEDKHEHHEH